MRQRVGSRTRNGMVHGMDHASGPQTGGMRYRVGKVDRELGLGLATAWFVGGTMSAVRRQADLDKESAW